MKEFSPLAVKNVNREKIKSDVLCVCVLVARITIKTGSVESVCIICRTAVAARADRLFDSSTIL